MPAEFLGKIKLVLFVRAASGAGRITARIFGDSVVWRVQSAKDAMSVAVASAHGTVLVVDQTGWSSFGAEDRARLATGVREGYLGVCIFSEGPAQPGTDAFEVISLPASDDKVVDALERVVVSQLRGASRPTPGAGTRRVRRRSILVVDDSELVNRITEMILTRAGYRVRCIASPFELYDKTKEEPTDLVLVDYNMPLRGDQVIATARRAGVTAPMILYSNAPEETLREAVRVSGASGFVSKGVAAEMVVQQVADAFARLAIT